MTKAARKKSRRLKRTVRKTLGTLFLVSALIIAAIPVDGLRAEETGGTDIAELAEDTTPEIRVDIFQHVPRVSPSATIYTTGDGIFQFAYVDKEGTQTGSDLEVVILGYKKEGELQNGLLEIPNTVDAYLKYSSSDGNYGFAAVNKRGEFLYYRFYDDAQYERDENNRFVLDANGDRILKADAKPEYRRCTYESRSAWKNLDVEKDFWYYDGNITSTTPSEGAPSVPVEPKNAVNEPERPILNAPVHYIGSQYLTPGTGADVDTWKIAGDINDKESWSIVNTAEQGVFYGVGNIQTLTIGGDLMGIGDHAFDSCTLMSSVTLNNGLEAIGNYAFANCINMKTANIAVGASVKTIGEHAFYNCQALETFNMPVAVQQVGDSAFESCQAMTNIYLNGESGGSEGNYNVLLTRLGKNVFKGCGLLEKLTFPQNFNNDGKGVDVSLFQGCSALKYIETSNAAFDLKAEKGVSIADFKRTVQADFYLRGLKDRPLHVTATANQIPYSFWDEALQKNVYELTVNEGNDPNKQVVYRVDEGDCLVYFEQKNPMSTPAVTLPSTIGPRTVSSIGAGTFQDKCYLERVTIPESVMDIASGAFKGSHNLKDVLFANPQAGMTIGAGAFKTQDVGTHACGATELPKTPVLNFVGPISYDAAPFAYAMDPSERINVGTQDETYINYQSGWPTNLEVRYNPATGKNTLVNYPIFTELENGNPYTAANYAYITPEYEAAAKNAALKYAGTYTGGDASLTDDEQAILNAVLNIELPEGIQAIGTMNGKGLFEYKEGECELLNDTAKAKMKKTLVANGLAEVEPNAFKGSKYLTSVILNGETTSIGDHAFADCGMLEKAEVPATVEKLGIAPFLNCGLLKEVYFNGGPFFSCDDSIIFEIEVDEESGERKHTKLVEYLGGKQLPLIQARDLEGITEIYPEAFMGTNVVSADLSGSMIKIVPERLFKNTQSLTSVILPDTCTQIRDEAFADSSIIQVKVPKSVNAISTEAFSGSTNKNNLVLIGEKGSPVEDYAEVNGIKFTEGDFEAKYTVTFYDDSTPPKVLKTQVVATGKAASPPTEEELKKEFGDDYTLEREGYAWSWKTEGNYLAVLENTDVFLFYTADKIREVIFKDENGNVIGKRMVVEGQAAEPMDAPEKEGYKFVGWEPPITEVTVDMEVTPVYKKMCEITFKDENGKVIGKRTVLEGEAVEPVEAPVKEGYKFVRWEPPLTEVTIDMEVKPVYASEKQYVVTFQDDDGTVLYAESVDPGKDAVASRTPTKAGYTFVEWRPYPVNVMSDMTVKAVYKRDGSGGSDDNGGSTGSDNTASNNTASRLYTLTVRGGSGSGSYAPGTQIIVSADNPARGQEFAGWTVSPAGTTVTDKSMSAIAVTMPANDVALIANYKLSSSSGTSTGTNNSSSSGNNRYPSGGNNGNAGTGSTTVVIDKNGLSNTGVVSVTVNGSSDNFTIKVSESADAAEKVLRALLAEYGSVDDIKYFPMDISLYDATGTKKITDTTGLKISITLPLPDSLREYAGNNKVAGVVNDRLDKLSPRFTTINGVPCVTFSAEHFSPYVIYADMGNLASNPGTDKTPQTGDGIHPKWFLSIGLACLSFIMFMQKDSRTKKKQKVRVRA